MLQLVLGNPPFLAIFTRLCWQLEFHIPNHFTLNIGIRDTERVRFCTGPEVNFDFFNIPPPLGHLRWWRYRYLLREFHEKYCISMGKKLALITSGAIGLPKTKPDSDPIKKRQTRWPDFHQIFPPPRGATRLFVIGAEPYFRLIWYLVIRPGILYEFFNNFFLLFH